MSDDNEESYERYQNNDSLVNLSDLQQLLDKENVGERTVPISNDESGVIYPKRASVEVVTKRVGKRRPPEESHKTYTNSYPQQDTKSGYDNINMGSSNKMKSNVITNSTNQNTSNFQKKPANNVSLAKENSIYNSMDLESLERMLRSTVIGGGSLEDIEMRGDLTFSVDNNNMSPLRMGKDTLIG